MEKEGTAEKSNDLEYREVVIPGEFLEERKGKKLDYTVYQEDGKVYAKVLGIPLIRENEIKIAPMSGIYIPRLNDKIVGIIKSVEISGWMVKLNSPYLGYLPVSDAVDEFVDVHKTDIGKFFKPGDVIFCKVSKVAENKKTRLTMRSYGARKLYGGVILRVKPTKVPRIIGRGGSMVNLIKDKTGCLIYVGKNGVIWVKGDNQAEAIEAILKVEEESHTIGLTENIEDMLEGTAKEEEKDEGVKNG